MKTVRNISLILASMSFLAFIGGGLYEDLVILPVWTSAPPLSLYIYQGNYGINSGVFWGIIHPVTILLLIVALISNWRTARRKQIVTVLIFYVVVLVVTAIYFIPELLRLISTHYENRIDAGLKSRAVTWGILSVIRLIGCIFLSFILLSSLTKPAHVTELSRPGT
jgi:Na+/phosphate symporter